MKIRFFLAIMVIAGVFASVSCNKSDSASNPSGPVNTSTITQTPTQTQTQTATNTPTETPTFDASCDNLFGNNVTPTGSYSDDTEAVFQQFTVSSAVTVRSIYAFVYTDPNALHQVAIYSDATGCPGSMLTYSTPKTVTGGTTGAWNAFNVTKVDLSTGTYWIAIISRSDPMSSSGHCGVGFYAGGVSDIVHIQAVTMAYGSNIPETISCGTSDTNKLISIYASCNSN